jgi:hypothetical protein
VSCRIYPQSCSTWLRTNSAGWKLIQQQVPQEKSVERSKLLMEFEQRMQDKRESLQQEAKEECEKDQVCHLRLGL